MKNFILAFVSTLLVIVVTPPTHKTIVHEEVPYIKKHSVFKPLVAPVHAEKQKLAQVPIAPQKAAVATVSGSCADWMAQAGITDIANATWLVMKESGCRPNAQNPTSTAYGTMQFLDGTWKGVGCTKTSDPVEQLRCGQKYVNARYGGWAGAISFWQKNRWY